MSAKIISLPFRAHTIQLGENAQDDARLELRRARIRIAQLEASLTQAMRDSLTNFNRARKAERALAERG